MAFREVHVIEIKEVLRLWLRGKGYRAIAETGPVDRKTVMLGFEAPPDVQLAAEGGALHSPAHARKLSTSTPSSSML